MLPAATHSATYRPGSGPAVRCRVLLEL